MKKIMGRVVVLLAAFLLGVVGTAFFQNSETTDDRSDMNSAVLPEVMVDLGGITANRMCGYVQKMQGDFTRDSITPLDTTRELTFVVNPYDTEVTSLSYEIRTCDGSRVLENRKVKRLADADGYLRAEVEITSDLRMNQEYTMQITLDTEAGEVYYYTRVVSRSGLNTLAYIRFVKTFYESCMDKGMADNLTPYMETTDTSGGINLSYVDIHSKLSAVSWGNLSPRILKRGIPVIKEINETTASITVEYQISAKDPEGSTEVYDVWEFYRMRYTDARILLLDFQRRTNQVFDPSLQVVSSDGLLLGVRNRNLSYLSSEENTVVAFVQQGDLWSYTPSTGKFVRIFSFRTGTGGDYRDSRTDHDIKIIRVEENGDVDFVLYGYMNRGIREGYTGVCVYHYSSDLNTVEEKVFIPSTESCEFLKEDLGTLSYVNQDNQLFLLLAEKLYQIDIEKSSYRILDRGILSEDFAVSQTNAYAAYRIREGDQAGRVRILEFETLRERYLYPGKNETWRPLGFMNEDLVVGIILDGDVLTDEEGRRTEGITSIRIESFQGELKKEYRQDPLYITDVTVTDTLMEFNLSSKVNNSYVFVRKDNILNNIKAVTNQIFIEQITSDRTGARIRLVFGEKPAEEETMIAYAKISAAPERVVRLDTQIPQEQVYYVYAGGGLDSIYTDPAQAILRADEQTGVVLNRFQQYVWERGNKKTRIILNAEDIPQAMRSGSLDIPTLTDGLGGSGSVMDLSGCSLDSVLYQVSAQRPVVARTGAGSATVIVGYDEYNTYLYDTATGEIYPYGLNDSTALFESAGNVFVSYIESWEY